jgi:preprotein translocase subunit YajC
MERTTKFIVFIVFVVVLVVVALYLLAGPEIVLAYKEYSKAGTAKIDVEKGDKILFVAGGEAPVIDLRDEEDVELDFKKGDKDEHIHIIYDVKESGELKLKIPSWANMGLVAFSIKGEMKAAEIKELFTKAKKEASA